MSLKPASYKTDYYPFGMGMPDRQYVGGYRYGFNGKEKDDEGMGGGHSTYDYGFRIYNPAIAKFLSVDPLTASYPWYTPYQFAGNKPIWAIDLDGLEEFIKTSFYNSSGELYRTEIQVIQGTTGGANTSFSNNTQLLHHSSVAFDCEGNYSVYYNGSTEGTWTGSPGRINGSSSVFNSAENAAIWSITPFADGSVTFTWPNELSGQIVSVNTFTSVVPTDGTSDSNDGVLVMNFPTTDGAPNPDQSAYCPVGISYVVFSDKRVERTDGVFNNDRKAGFELVSGRAPSDIGKGLDKVNGPLDTKNNDSYRGAWSYPGEYSVPSHTQGSIMDKFYKEAWQRGVKAPCTTGDSDCKKEYKVSIKK